MKLKINQLVLAKLDHVNIYHPNQFLGRIKRVFGQICHVQDMKGNMFRIPRINIKPNIIKTNKVN